MNVQLREIILWNAKGDDRRLGFRPGKLNVITGASSTGKTALIDIVDYCMAADECRVPGIIRKIVAWYGIILSIGRQQLLIARRAPMIGAKSSHEIYIEQGADIDLPAFDNLRGNTNLEGLEELLTSRIGISPNVNVPPEDSTRDALSATVRHALKFCFQPQYEIASRSILFHRQGEPFMAQAMIDTLPYFLGAVREDYLLKQGELRLARRALKRALRAQGEDLGVSGGWERGLGLLAEAQQVGLVQRQGLPASLKELERDLAEASRWEPKLPPRIPNSETLSLQAEIAELERRRWSVHSDIEAARSFSKQLQGYSDEASEQVARLESVDIFKVDPADSRCPVCLQNVSNQVPAISELRQGLTKLKEQLSTFEGGRPRLEAHISERMSELQEIEARIRERRGTIKQIRAISAEALLAFDASVAQAFVAGRIRLYLESVGDTLGGTPFATEIEVLQRQIAELEREIDEPGIDSRVRASLSIASEPMTGWAKQLGLEYGSSPLRIDWRGLTVIASTDDGELPLSRMGSGKNWVGYHLIAHFALHRFFLRKGRPLPRFLILDQPTQVFYPPDQDKEGDLKHLKDDDRKAVQTMFRWINDRTEKLAPNFQVIIMDHADLKDEKFFQEAVVAKWRDGEGLIPKEWL